MRSEHCIYVRLLGECVDVWRPVQATPIERDVYRILEQTYDRDLEEWEFEPGEVVECQLTRIGNEDLPAALKRKLVED